MTTYTLTAEDVRATVSMREAIDAVRQAFLALSTDAFEQPNRTVLSDGRFLMMPVHHRPTATAAIKSVSINFDRTPAITGTVTWADANSADHLIAAAAPITTLRTGAITGVATDLLAPKYASRMVLIGAGAQGGDQIRAVHAVRPLSRLTVVDQDAARAQQLLDDMAEELEGVETTISTDIPAAIADTDIINCATSTKMPLFAADQLPEQVHVNGIGSFRPTMRELPSELFTDSLVVIDDLHAILEESGEVLHALRNGFLKESDMIELGAALEGAELPTAKRTVFKSVGIGAQDWAIMSVLANKVLKKH